MGHFATKVKTLNVWYTFLRLGTEETEGRGRETGQEPRGREGDARPRLRPAWTKLKTQHGQFRNNLE